MEGFAGAGLFESVCSTSESQHLLTLSFCSLGFVCQSMLVASFEPLESKDEVRYPLHSQVPSLSPPNRPLAQRRRRVCLVKFSAEMDSICGDKRKDSDNFYDFVVTESARKRRKCRTRPHSCCLKITCGPVEVIQKTHLWIHSDLGVHLGHHLP